MELKYNIATLLKSTLEGFNRTFMELKLVVCFSLSLCRSVLIVPLWN